jgi:hypothetical protein
VLFAFLFHGVIYSITLSSHSPSKPPVQFSGSTIAGHKDAANPGHIVARIENVPLPAQERLELSAEVHWARHLRHPNIA